MRTSRRRWLMIGAMLAAILSAWGIHRWRAAAGPIYAGHSVAYWYAEACGGTPGDFAAFERALTGRQALCELGTNALPFLVRRALGLRPEPAWVNRSKEWLGEHVHGSRLSFLTRSHRDELTRAATLIAEVCSENPQVTLLPFFRSALDSTDPRRRLHALTVLNEIHHKDPALAPYLGRALHDADEGIQWRATCILGWMGTNGVVALPDLIVALRQYGTDVYGQLPIPRILGSMGSRASPALPLLRERFAAVDHEYLRWSLAVALCQIDGSQTEAMTWIINHLVRTQVEPWRHFSLTQLGTNGKAAVPALLTILKGTNSGAVWWVPRCLQEVGTPPESYLPRLRELVASSDHNVRQQAAERILAVAPGDEQALAALDALQTKPLAPVAP